MTLSIPSQITLRAYLLGFGLSAGPALLPLLTSSKRSRIPNLLQSLKRELRYDALAFSMATAVGGGAFVRELWKKLEPRLEQHPWYRKLSSESEWAKDLLANIFSTAIALSLLHSARCKRRPARLSSGQDIPYTLPVTESMCTRASPTIDLTILLFIRAMDALLQSKILPASPKKLDPTPGSLLDIPQTLEEQLNREKWQRLRAKSKHLCAKIDALVFWACSARIMWCWFYKPHRLPRSYVKWINSLARVDYRLSDALRDIRSGKWKYGEHCAVNLDSYSRDLGYPPSWGDPAQLPSIGGKDSNAVWEKLGLLTRNGLGGLPCELVHGDIGTSSCTRNAAQRGLNAMAKAVLIYIPAHFIPILIARPYTLLQPAQIIATLKAVLRSATFLSTFISSFWFAVCFTRTTVLSRFFPGISHNFWDSPWGCIMAGCLACGQSIFIEDGKRRGEMALYVLPRAFKSWIPQRWLRSDSLRARLTERVTFIVSLSYLLTTATHRPDSLRGLSRWMLAFIMKGSNAGFWKRKRSSTPVEPPMTPLSNGEGVDKKDA